MYSRVETITPELAQLYLTKNINNRKTKPHAIANYARDMASGQWQLSPQGISFYENGNLADGQNRLFAVIKANVPVDFYVTYDVPNESTIQDRCVSRSVADILKMSGDNSSAATSNGVALVNMLFNLAGRNKVSESVICDFVAENHDLLNAALSVVNRGSSQGAVSLSRKAPFAAAAFCALYCGLSEEGLAKFFTSVNTGFYDGDKESAAIFLRNFIMQSYQSNTDSGRRYGFATATNAIKDYANGVPRTRRYKENITPAFWPYTKKKAIDKYMKSYSL